jgi:hypothetical protein
MYYALAYITWPHGMCNQREHRLWYEKRNAIWYDGVACYVSVIMAMAAWHIAVSMA